jgi:protein O-GlcNAc transferase
MHYPSDTINPVRSPIEISPQDTETIASQLQQGEQFQQQGQWDQAIAAYQRVVKQNAQHPLTAIAYHQLGMIAHQQRRLAEAAEYYRQALLLNPAYGDAHNNLGNVFSQQGRLKEAEQCYRFALQWMPEDAALYKNLANVLSQQGRVAEALQACQQALHLNPDYAEGYYDLGHYLTQQNRQEEAIAAYQQAIALKPNDAAAQLALCMARLPILSQTGEERDQKRQQYQQQLQQLVDFYQTASPEVCAQAAAAIGTAQPFYLAYQGQCDRELQQIYGQLICRLTACRFPQWSQSLPLRQFHPGEKIRVGFVSGYFRDHSVWKIPLRGWIENLDRSEFELLGYYTRSHRDGATLQAARTFDKFTQGEKTVEEWAEMIDRDRPDVLIFSEFGMDATSVQLGCLRLAPVQMTTWGHPETSGMPTIDYYLSSDLMEVESAQSHYTEKLIRLPNLSVHCPSPETSIASPTRVSFSIASDAIIFWCCQSLFKYLPEHDDIFPRIALAVPNAKFLFIQGANPALTEQFKIRIEQAFQAFQLQSDSYCQFLPRMAPTQFTATTAIADVFLDSIGWSGCNSTLEAIAHNLPIVTLPGDVMRSRHSYAILKMMGLDEAIAQNKQDYIRIAIQLGQDQPYRQQLSQRIAQQKQQLYGDLAPVKALEDVLLETCQKERNTNSPAISDALRQALHCNRAQRWEAAEQYYLQVLALDSKQPEALNGLGVLMQRRGDLATAEQMLKAVTQVQPHSVKAWFNLGNLYQLQGKLVEAIEAYWQAVALRADSAAIYNNLGYALQQLEQWEEAVFCYQKALELQPGSIEINVSLANAWHVLGKLSPDDYAHYATTNLKLGLSRQKVGDNKSAIAYFQQALRLQPDLPEAQQGLRELQDSLDPQASHPIMNPPAMPEKSDLELLKKISGAVWNWAKTGFATVDEATFQKRYDTCMSCPNLKNAPKKFLYRAIALNQADEKVCSLCGCVVVRKAQMTSESCPDRHPTQAGLNRWEEPI